MAVGRGHPDGVAFWCRFIEALGAIGYDGPLSIENEDYAVSQCDSVTLAARTLNAARAAWLAGRGAPGAAVTDG